MLDFKVRFIVKLSIMTIDDAYNRDYTRICERFWLAEVDDPVV